MLKIQVIFSLTVLVFFAERNTLFGKITDIYSVVWNENDPNATKKILLGNLKYPKEIISKFWLQLLHIYHISTVKSEMYIKFYNA